MQNNDFRQQAHRIIDFLADYAAQIEKYPVMSLVQPGDIKGMIPEQMPEQGEDFANIFADFNNIIMPGITHWQHPGFMALFPSNGSVPSLLAEFLTAGLGVNAMVWETSPAATELEERVMEWLRDACGLPAEFHGVIQDTASTSTMLAILCARERASGFTVRAKGCSGIMPFTCYCSEEAHYSFEKDARLAGFGDENIRKIPAGADYAMQPDILERAIREDLAANKKPCIIEATLGTTGALGFDPLEEIAALCARHNIWLHVDAAYAGSAFLLPEYRHWLRGIEQADSYVFNPHKWLFTHFDCSAFFVRDRDLLLRVFSSDPEYMKRNRQDVVQYKDWGIALGRRFRALKLWFVMRSFGLEGLQERLRTHIRLAERLYNRLHSKLYWEFLAPLSMNVLCFRLHPEHITEEATLDSINTKIITEVNAGGKYFVSGTRLKGKFVIRIVPAQTQVNEKHVDGIADLLEEIAAGHIK